MNINIFFGDINTNWKSLKISSAVDLYVSASPIFKGKEEEDFVKNNKNSFILGNMVPTQRELKLAKKIAETVYIKLNKFDNGTESKVGKYWLWYAGTYLKVSFFQNCLSIVLIRRFIKECKPEKIKIYRDEDRMVVFDFIKPGSGLGDNTASFYIQEYCKNKNIEVEVNVEKKIRRIIKRVYYKEIYSRMVLCYRYYSLLKDSFRNPEYMEDAELLVIERASRFSKLIDDLVDLTKIRRAVRVRQLVMSDKNSDNNISGNATYTPGSFIKTFDLLKIIFNARVNSYQIRSPDSLIDKYLKEYIDCIGVYRNIPYVYYRIVDKSLKCLRPIILLSIDESSVFNRMFYHVAKEMKIKTLAIQHGEITEIDYILLHKEKYCDLLVVNSLETKKKYIEWGCESIVTYYNVHACAKSKYNGNGELVTILVAATSIGEKRFSKQLSSLADKLRKVAKGVEIKFKPHPLESIELYRKILNSHENKIDVISHGGSNKYLDRIDLVISINSSIALEVGMRGIPVIMNNDNGLLLTGLTNQIFRNFESEEKMIEFIKEISLSKEKYAIFLEEFSIYAQHCYDGLSRDEIINFCASAQLSKNKTAIN